MMSRSPQFPDGTSISARRIGLLHRLSRGCAAVLLSMAWFWSQSALAAEPQVTEGFINASPSEVWRIFTTAEGYKQTGVASADVDFRIGGTIRTHYAPN